MQRSLLPCGHHFNCSIPQNLKHGRADCGQQPVAARAVNDGAPVHRNKAVAAILAASLALQPIQLYRQLVLPRNAHAHVAIDKLMQQKQQEALQQMSTAGFDPAASATARGVPPTRSTSQGPSNSSNIGSSSSRPPGTSVASAASQALQQLSAADAASQTGNYQAALQAYTSVVQEHSDLALAEYARLGRALMLYQLGDANKSIVALEDLELSMRGYPEVHAALAAVLYAERPTQRLRAEQQWDIALEFDARYQGADWVAKNKHWPPALMTALQRFLLLQ